MQRIAIAGAGVLGRLAAWTLARAGHQVTVVDPSPGPHPRNDGQGPAGFTAAGMLSPLAELDHASADIALLGWQSLALWSVQARILTDQLGLTAPLMRQRGSLMLAHGSDQGAARRVLDRLETAARVLETMPSPQSLDRTGLQRLEPALDPQLKAWLLPGEGQVMPSAMLSALVEGTRTTPHPVDWQWGRKVTRVHPGALHLEDGQTLTADCVLDVRGLGARPVNDADAADPNATMSDLRGVRGEVVWLHAPGVELSRPVRLLHPRHRVYLVPRPGHLFVLGASEVESEDRSTVSLRSGVELMAAAHSVLPALAEARIVHLETNLRPALPDNGPRTIVEDGLVAVNGLFRHGWLLAPAVLQRALDRAGLTHTLVANDTTALH